MKLWSSGATSSCRASSIWASLIRVLCTAAAVTFFVTAIHFFVESVALADIAMPTPPPPGNVVAANASGAVTSGAVAAAPSPFHFILGTVNFFLIAFFVYYILVLRPSQLKQEEQIRFVKGLKSNDPVVTSGGILGRISAMSPEYITIEVAPGMKLRVTPDHVYAPDGKPVAAAESKALRAIEKEKKAK